MPPPFFVYLAAALPWLISFSLELRPNYALANTLKLQRSGNPGFIDWLGLICVPI